MFRGCLRETGFSILINELSLMSRYDFDGEEEDRQFISRLPGLPAPPAHEGAPYAFPRWWQPMEMATLSILASPFAPAGAATGARVLDAGRPPAAGSPVRRDALPQPWSLLPTS